MQISALSLRQLSRDVGISVDNLQNALSLQSVKQNKLDRPFKHLTLWQARKLAEFEINPLYVFGLTEHVFLGGFKKEHTFRHKSPAKAPVDRKARQGQIIAIIMKLVSKEPMNQREIYESLSLCGYGRRLVSAALDNAVTAGFIKLDTRKVTVYKYFKK